MRNSSAAGVKIWYFFHAKRSRFTVGGNKGFVTRFEVEDSFCGRYKVQTVGRSYHQELWIPAEELDAFNSHIIGKIEIIAEYGGEK